MSYGANVIDAYRQIGAIAARVLNGEKPRDITGAARHKNRTVHQSQIRQRAWAQNPKALNLHPDELIE
jgi:ABC-type uncharacterized transport system substrate-binding protein